jgi:hypothetical protein
MKRIFGSRSGGYLIRISIFLLVVALLAAMAGCDGNPSQNLEIRDWYDLDAVRDNPGGHHTLMNDLDSTTDGYVELAGPTAHGGKGWEPIIGYYSPAPSAFADSVPEGFAGIFDGQGHEIRDLFVDRPDESGVAIFSIVSGSVEDTGAVNVTVTGRDSVGGLVASLDGSGAVTDSYCTGSVTGQRWVGGLIGMSYGSARNSRFAGTVTGEESIGGLVGWNGIGATLSNSYFTGTVAGNHSVGGLAGHSHSSTVSNSYYDYDEVLINGENVIAVGALFHADFEEWLTSDRFLDVNDRLSQEGGHYLIRNISDFKQLLAFGQNSSLRFRLANDLDLAAEPDLYIPYLGGVFDGDGHRISNLSFNLDFVSAAGLFAYLASGGEVISLAVENVNIAGDENVGGLVGFSDGTVSNSSSSGSVNGNKQVGGLVGMNLDGIVSSSCSSSSVVTGERGGGLIGWDSGTVSDSYSTGSVTGNDYIGGLTGTCGWISNCYSTGSVTGTSHTGGLVGYLGGFANNCFWDTQTSGQAASAGGTDKTTVEMKDIFTYSGAGWNIVGVALNETNPSYIWNIVNNVTYPFLSWQPVA